MRTALKRGLVMVAGTLLLLVAVPGAAHAAPPVIASFTPATGPVGTSVTITGTDLTGATAVRFGTGNATTFVVDSDTQITALVPFSATTGRVRVTVAGITAVSTTNFTVTFGVALSLTAGPPTTTLKVMGTVFNANEAVDIYFDTTNLALVTTNTNGGFSMTITVPTSAIPGTHYVTAIGRRSGLAEQAAFLVRTNWDQLGFGPQRRGFNPLENVVGVNNVAGLNLAWVTTTAGPIHSTPAVVGGIAYVGSDDGKLYALDTTTGTAVWTATTGGPIQSSPAVVNGVVYVGSQDHILYALEAATGATLWTFPTGAAISSSPTVVNGIVYIGSADSNMYARDAATGGYVWTMSLQSAITTASPAVANGVVYIGTDNGQLRALNAATGTPIWTFPTSGPITGVPAVANGQVFFTVYGALYRVAAATGSGGVCATTYGVFGSPSVLNGVVYVGTSSTGFLEPAATQAFNATTCSQLWSRSLSGFAFQVPAQPTLANGLLYLQPNDGNLYALNASNGTMMWTGTVGMDLGFGSLPTGGAVIADGVVYAGSTAGSVTAFNLTSALAAAKQLAAPDRTKLRPTRSLKATPSDAS